MASKPGPQPGPSGRGRAELAAAGQAQARELLAAAHQLLEAYGGEPGGAGAEQRGPLQERYLAAAAALRGTLAQCASLEGEEAAAAAAQRQAAERGGRGTAQALAPVACRRHRALLLRPPRPPPTLPRRRALLLNPHSPPWPDDPDAAALAARAAELRARLEAKNALVKAAIDRLRALLDALAMWDSSRRELAAAVG
jgi:hypothetical protein